MEAKKLLFGKQKSKIDGKNLPIFIAIFILFLFTLTSLHEFLHYAVGYSFGWDLQGFYIGVMTGFTTMNFESTATPLQQWLYYISPSFTLCATALIAVLLHPTRFIGIWAIVIYMLNIASAIVMITDSDANNALNILLNSSLSPILSYILMYGYMFLIVIFCAIVLYIMMEDNQKDAERRAYDVTH